MIRFILALLKFTFRWVIPLIGLAALIGFPLLLLNINQCIRTEAVRTLQHYFPNAVLKLESAEFSPGQGIRIRGLQLKIPERSFLRNSQITVLPGEVVMPSRKGDNYDFLFIEEVFFSSPTNWLGLVCCGFQPETVHLRNADIVLHSVDKTHWNWQFLEFVNPKKNKPTLIKELVFEDVDCQIRDYRKEGAVYELRDIGGKLLLQNDKSYELTGTMTGDYAKAMEFSGKVCPLEKRWHIEGNILECEVSPRLIKVLPMECTPQSEFFDNITKNGVLKNIQGVLSLNYSIVYDSAPKEGNKLKFNVNGTLHHGRWDWEGLPDSLSELESQFEANESGIYVKSYNGKIGGGNIAASFRQWTFTSNAPKNVKMRLDNIELNPRMEILLPEKIRPIWRMIQPQGVLNSNIELQFDGTKWIPKINVECKKGGLLFEKFPFKLEDVFGSIQWDRDMLQLTLSDGKHIAFGANFVFPATGLAGHFRLKAQNMPVNEKLIKACPEIAQSIINDFDPKGTVNVEFGMDFPGNKQPAGKFLNITLLNCSGRYAKFPYPLRNVNGILEMKDDFWTFKNLSCNNTPSAITGSGSLNLNPTENKDFLLSLKLTDLPLDKTLAAAMPEDNARLLEGLGASGSIDAQVEVFMRIEKSAKPEIKIHAVPIGNQMSVRAASLPYRLDNVSGNIEFQNDQFTIRDFIGTHGQTQLSCQINGKVIPGQGWQAKLTQVAVDRLNLDRDLLEALPAGVRKNITNLNISGPIHYHGSLDLNYNANLPIPISGQWDGELGLHEVSISKGITLRGICGGVTTKGYFSDNFFYSQGELAIDSLLWDSIQFARIKGPYQINNDQLYLGTGANDLVKRIFPNDKNTFSEPMNYGKPYSVSARIFGGDIAADIAILMGENPRFGIFTEMRNVRLEQCGEVTQSEKLRGKIDMLVNIWGTAGDMNSLSGLGDLRLSEADIYQLPAMVSMLKLLSIREPNTNAFSNSEAVFRIVGPHLFFDKINFRGDAISLYGNGEMDFNRRVNMSFYPLVGKGEVEIPIINALFRGVSKNTMMIRMDGTLSDLKIWRESPLVNDFRGVENGLFSQ